MSLYGSLKRVATRLHAYVDHRLSSTNTAGPFALSPPQKSTSLFSVSKKWDTGLKVPNDSSSEVASERLIPTVSPAFISKVNSANSNTPVDSSLVEEERARATKRFNSPKATNLTERQKIVLD